MYNIHRTGDAWAVVHDIVKTMCYLLSDYELISLGKLGAMMQGIETPMGYLLLRKIINALRSIIEKYRKRMIITVTQMRGLLHA